LAITIRITAIRQAGGTGHEHITHLWWTDPVTGDEGSGTRGEIVRLIEVGNARAYLDDGQGHRAAVLVVTPRRGEKYLQTCADGLLTDNLLALPRRW
jgi:hypothetical protein